MECSAGERRLLMLGDFQMCRSWKMWNFFGDFAAAVASRIATNELQRAHGVMKQSDGHASHLPTDRLRRSIFTAFLYARLPDSTAVRVVIRNGRLFPSSSSQGSAF